MTQKYIHFLNLFANKQRFMCRKKMRYYFKAEGFSTYLIKKYVARMFDDGYLYGKINGFVALKRGACRKIKAATLVTNPDGIQDRFLKVISKKCATMMKARRFKEGQTPELWLALSVRKIAQLVGCSISYAHELKYRAINDGWLKVLQPNGRHVENVLWKPCGLLRCLKAAPRKIVVKPACVAFYNSPFF